MKGGRPAWARYAPPRPVKRLTEALAPRWKGKIPVNAVLAVDHRHGANRASMPQRGCGKGVAPQGAAN